MVGLEGRAGISMGRPDKESLSFFQAADSSVAGQMG
jgi:hypothetical protein